MSHAVEIAVSLEEGAWAEDLPDAEALVMRAAAAALDGADGVPSGPAELSVVLADDELVRQLNHRYRDKDKPTNVLSFPLRDEGEDVMEMLAENGPLPILLGDVILAHGTLVREAAEQGKSLADHLAHLVVHGVLHLLGYDHITDADADRMESLETEILAGLGISDPYDGRAGTPDDDPVPAGTIHPPSA